VAWLRSHRTGLGWDPGVLLLMGAGVRPGVAVPWRPTNPIGGLGHGVRGRRIVGSDETCSRSSSCSTSIFRTGTRDGPSVCSALFAIAAGVTQCCDTAAGAVGSRKRRFAGRLRLATALIAPVVVTLVLLPHARSVCEAAGGYTTSRTSMRSSPRLPKTALVAAHPDLADFIPVRSRRSVLTSTEISMAWMEGYYAQMKPRVEASLRAAYATTIETTSTLR
jgi:hypothetical protein